MNSANELNGSLLGTLTSSAVSDAFDAHLHPPTSLREAERELERDLERELERDLERVGEPDDGAANVPTGALTDAVSDASFNAPALVVQRLPGLRERGLSVATCHRFGLVEIYLAGIQYPTPGFAPTHTSGFDGRAWQPGGGRVMGTYPGQARVAWLDADGRVRPHPAFYGTPAFTEEGKLAAQVILANEVWIVPQESDVWTLAQCGLEALCPLSADSAPLVEFLACSTKAGAGQVVGRRTPGINVFIICAGDAAWRQRAALLQSVCLQVGVFAALRVLQGSGEVVPRDVSALFAQLKFESGTLQGELEFSPYVTTEMARGWQSDPECGWVEPAATLPCLHGEALALPSSARSAARKSNSRKSNPGPRRARQRRVKPATSAPRAEVGSLSEKAAATLQALRAAPDAGSGASLKTWRERAAALGVSKASFHRVRVELMRNGHVQCEDIGANEALYRPAP